MSLPDQTVLVIGSQEADHLAIGPLFAVDGFGYGSMAVSGKSGPFSASIECETSRHDLAALRTCLEAQRKNPATEQSWLSSDGELQIGFSGNVLGSIRASVRIAEIGEQNRTLGYNLDLDQSYLPDLISRLSMILASMPEAQS
jgi:hypothetical protein